MRADRRLAIVHEHVPELFQLLERFVVRRPIRPALWLVSERRLGSADHCRVDEPVRGDALCEPRHGRTSEFLGHVARPKTKPAVPLERKRITSADLLETVTGRRADKRRI